MNAYNTKVVPMRDVESLAVHIVGTNAPAFMDVQKIHAIKMDIRGLTLIRTDSTLYHDLHETSYVLDGKTVHDEYVPRAGLVEVNYRNYTRTFEAFIKVLDNTNIPVDQYDWEELEDF